MANEVLIHVKAKDDASKTMGAVSGNAKKMGVAAGVAAVAIGGVLVKALGDCVAEATEAKKVSAQTEAVLKSTGNTAKISATGVEKLATAISNKTGIDDEAIQSGENLLLTFTNIRNETGKGNDVFNQATMAITDMSVAMGQDMKTSAIQVGKALNDPVKGMTALQRVGVTFTDQQKDMVKKLVKSGDTLGAQKIILEELRKEFGGSAEAAATWADKAKVAADNVKEAFGKKMLPALEKVSKWFVEEGADSLSTFVENFDAQQLMDAADAVIQIAEAVNDLGGALKTLRKGSGGGVSELGDEFVSLKAKALDALADIMEGAAKWQPWLRDNAAAVRDMANKADAEYKRVREAHEKSEKAIKNKPIIAQFKADKKNAEDGMRSVKRQLADPKLTATKRAKLEAKYDQLVRAKRAAQAHIDALRGKTVFIWMKTIKTTQQGPGSAGRRAAGGNIGGEGMSTAASGGPRGNQVLVGEQGPEIVDLPLGSHVNSNPDSQRMMATSGRGGDGGTHFHFHGPVYGDHNALRRALVDMKRSGQLDVVMR